MVKKKKESIDARLDRIERDLSIIRQALLALQRSRGCDCHEPLYRDNYQMR
jgi:hypothetical protein